MAASADSPPPPISPRPIKPSSVSTSTIVRTKRPQWQPFACRSGASKGTVTVVALMSAIFTWRTPPHLLPGKGLRLVFFESLLRFLYAVRQRTLRESLKIGQTRVFPPNCVALLNLQLLRHFGVTFRINHPGQRVPFPACGARPIHAALIMQRQFIPQGPSRTHSMVPGRVMKPDQKLFRASSQAGEPVTRWRMILANGIAASLRAIESQPAFVGAVVIGRIPVGPFFLVPPRRGAVMMPAPHNVMQPQRRHVIHQRLVRFEHHARDRVHRFLIARERHPDPLLGDPPRRDVRIPCETTECVPVGLGEMMPAPVAIRSGVGHARDARQPLLV